MKFQHDRLCDQWNFSMIVHVTNAISAWLSIWSHNARQKLYKAFLYFCWHHSVMEGFTQLQRQERKVAPTYSIRNTTKAAPFCLFWQCSEQKVLITVGCIFCMGRWLSEAKSSTRKWEGGNHCIYLLDNCCCTLHCRVSTVQIHPGQFIMDTL